MRFFNFRGNGYNSEIYTISIVGEKLYFLYKTLSEIDISFSKLNLISSTKKNIIMDINNLSEIEGISILRNYILENNLKDIKKYDKIKTPTIDYQRNFGFSSYIETSNITLYCGLGGNNLHFYTMLNSPTIEKDYQMCLDILKAFVANLQPQYACLQLTVSSIANEFLKYKYPLGWATFFSEKFNLKIPLNLDGFEVTESNGGFYLIVSEKDPMSSKEEFQKQLNKLRNTMEYLSIIIPEYLEIDAK